MNGAGPWSQSQATDRGEGLTLATGSSTSMMPEKGWPGVAPAMNVGTRCATVRSLLALAVASSVFACRPSGTSPGLPADPLCVAQDADMRQVTCPAPPRSYDGDRCTCVNAETRAVFVGRVQGGK